MDKLQEISSCTIRASHTSSTNIHLTPWDLQLLLVQNIQKGLLYRKPKPQDDAQELLDRLKKSLSRTLDFFPHLAGRLAVIKHEDDTQSFFIDCNNAGAQFTHAIACGISVNDIVEAKYVPKIVRSLFQLNEVRNLEGTNKPLLAVQITELEDGYFIGCTVNHCVVDGTSFWHFMNSWSEISRQLTSPSKIPSVKRWFPEEVNCPIHIPLFNENATEEKVAPLPWEERVFHFKKEMIQKLKKKATFYKPGVSSLQAVLAHLWLAVIRCRSNKDNTFNSQEIRLNLLVSARQRLEPPLVDGYFGNTVHILPVKTTPGELLCQGFGYAALRLNEAVAVQTHAESRKFYEEWAKCPHIFSKTAIMKNSLTISSSPRFDVYGNDFGWGKPVAVRSGTGNKGDGKVTVFTGPEPGSLDIEVCLSYGTLADLDEDEEFMSFVSL